MATDDVTVMDSDKFTHGSPLDGVRKGFGENVSGLVLCRDVAEVDPSGSNNLCEPMQFDTVRASKMR
jgi:hypothetical protein